jgi:pyruvate formate lyase activating enzyme
MRPAEVKKGLVLQILRMSTEDGPGIRTSVFFKGCPLGCLWCHNPESISPKPQIHWLKASCIGCGICVETCPEKALEKTPDGIVINRLLCTGCGLCTEECPTTAMELLGGKWSVPDLVRELVKDRVYFEQSGGGVTLSGGEPALQHEFCLPLLKELRAKGISTALDTCGQAPQKTLAALLPYVDVLLYDLKEIDPEKHKGFTGADNAKILNNAVFAARFKKSHPYPRTLWIRTPVIPDATDTPENIAGIGRFIRENLEGAVDRWELCAFNHLCRDKYERLGLNWTFANAELVEKSLMENLTKVAKSATPETNVCWSGSTRLEKSGDSKEPPQRQTERHPVRVC